VLRAVPDDKLPPKHARWRPGSAPTYRSAWLTKQSLWLNQGVASLEAACEIESRAVFMAQSTEDAAEKRQSFLEKRAPRFVNR
jgi:enoyl-CoA hydratase